jgi:hypothetical protein
MIASILPLLVLPFCLLCLWGVAWLCGEQIKIDNRKDAERLARPKSDAERAWQRDRDEHVRRTYGGYTP